jgi:hypothetical protein
MNWVIDSAMDWVIDPEIETAIEIASTQTKSAFADSRNATRVGGFRLCRRGFNRRVFLNPLSSGFVCIDAVSTAGFFLTRFRRVSSV